MAIEVEEEPGLFRLIFTGMLSDADLIEVGRLAAVLEDGRDVFPNRLADLTQAQGVSLSFNGILGLAEKRRVKDFPNPFRTAILVTNDVQRGFARMFQTLMDHPQVTIRIFDNAAAAMAWLKE
jgi:hypothetical protein